MIFVGAIPPRNGDQMSSTITTSVGTGETDKTAAEIMSGFPTRENFLQCRDLYRPTSPLLVGYRVEYAKYSAFWDGPFAGGAGVVVDIDLWGVASVSDDRGFRVKLEGCYAYRIVDIPCLIVGQWIAFGKSTVRIDRVTPSCYWFGEAMATPFPHGGLVYAMQESPITILRDAGQAMLYRAGHPIESLAHYPAEVLA